MSDADFAAALARLGPFEAQPRLAVAASGGPDSLALTLLADRWARRCGGAILVLSVDHRLRPESGAELAQLGRWLAARAIPHEILVWEGAKPATGIQAAARSARYRLLAERCRAAGILHLVTAHHRDDQVETHLIRRRAGSGVVGLAGMPAIRELAGCRLLRPLLGVPKSRLVALLAAERQPFLSDPSNRNPIFERARLRERPTDADALVARLADLAQCAAARRRIEDAAATLLARAALVHPGGFAVFDPDAVAAASAAIAEAALAALITTVGGAPYAPRRAGLARLRETLATPSRHGTTLGGCRLRRWRGRVLVLRELARAAPPLPLAPGASGVWDGRFAASLPAAAPRPVVIGHLGVAGVAEWHRASPRAATSLPPLVYPHLAAARDETGLLCVPQLGYRREPAIGPPRLRFRPKHPTSGAGFTVV